MNAILPFLVPVSLPKILLAGLLLLAASQVRAGPTPDELIGLVGIAKSDVSRLNNGEIVSFSVSEPNGKALADGIAVYLKTAPSKIIEAVKRGDLLAHDPDVIAYGTVPPEASVEAFANFAYTAAQIDEARELLNAQAGSDFNLSTQEIGRFAALKTSIDTDDDKAVIEAVSNQYRSILAERMRAYRSRGLKGIASYDRGKGENGDPSTELTMATLASKLLATYFPDLHKALLQFPANLPEHTESQFRWVNRVVQDRPTPILIHRLLFESDYGAVLLQRAFYVGHSYNCSQIFAGTLPYQDGALVLYSVRSSTDQVSGMGEALKHAVGRKQMEQEMIKKLQALKAKVNG